MTSMNDATTTPTGMRAPMRNARLLWFATLVLAMSVATYGFGWLGVAVCAVAWAWIRRNDATVPMMAALAGALSWGVLLVAGGDSTGRVAEVAGAAMQVGPLALKVLTVAFPALLAASLAGVVRGFAREQA
jgi:hypothetical protein